MLVLIASMSNNTIDAFWRKCNTEKTCAGGSCTKKKRKTMKERRAENIKKPLKVEPAKDAAEVKKVIIE